MQAQNNLLTIQNLQYENLKERMDETRRARHDLRQHMAVILSLHHYNRLNIAREDRE